MVDFKKRLKKPQVEKRIDPLEIYDSLDRSSEVGPLRPSQAAVLKKWYESNSSSKNSIIKLHTGEGKTLIGLLVLQSRLNSSGEPVVFVCPNKYLAEQVKEEARKFGIQYCDFSEGSQLPDDFLCGNKILITHIQKLFNGKTVFGLRNKSISVDTIIIDDSHACIDSIKSALTIDVDSQHPLYVSLLTLFHDEIRDQGEGSFMEIEEGEYGTMLPIPYWSWIDKVSEVTQAILENKDCNEVAFVWPIIKDLISNCQAFISGQRLEITPSLMPIDVFGSFSGASQRILMSATTQDDSFFIKGLGFDVSSVLHPITNPDLKWSGEKMVLMPSLISDSLDRDVMINWIMQPVEKRAYGIVSLVPSFKRKAQYEKIGAEVADSGNIFDLVQKLKTGDYEKSVVFVNRYDGIDLPDSACRILVIDSKPYFDSLLDRYEEDCRPSSDIVNIRSAQVIEQGLGRSVRGEKDFSVILLLGGNLMHFAKSPVTSKYFSSQTRKQIEIGMQVAKYAVEDSSASEPYQVVSELIEQVLSRDEGWKDYYSEEMASLPENQVSTKMHASLKHEFEAESLYSIGEYGKACEIAQMLCDSAESETEKGWYLQMLARFKYRISKTESDSIQRSAFQKNVQLLKPREGVSYEKVQYMNQSRLERIANWVSYYSTYEELMLAVDGMLQDLSFGMPSEKFEKAMHDLGCALGFLSQRPDKEIKKGPDNLWCGVANSYFIFECKNEVKETRLEINKHESGQMNTHCAWFEKEYEGIEFTAFLVIPTKKLSYHGEFSKAVRVIKLHSLSKLKKNVRNFFKEYANYNIKEVGETKVGQFIIAHKLQVDDFAREYSEAHTKASA